MLLLRPFTWRLLTPNAALEHCLTDQGVLLLRTRDEARRARPPILQARVRNGAGGLYVVPVDTLGFTWVQAENGDGWMLRTAGEPVTMARVGSHWNQLVRGTSSALQVDERVLLALIASEVRDAEPDADGQVAAPRTEKGYPRRVDETDPGDFERDKEDWIQARGTHSSHGLLQTLIGTAISVRPDLFDGIDPSHYRTVLWDPAHAVACGAAYLAGFPASVRADPLATRFQYAAGNVTPTAKERWGALLYDELVPLWFVAFWNDDACLRAGESVTLAASTALVPAHGDAGTKTNWIWLGVAGASAVTCLIAGWCALQAKRDDASNRSMDDDEDEDLGDGDDEDASEDDEDEDDEEEAVRPRFLLPSRARAAAE